MIDYFFGVSNYGRMLISFLGKWEEIYFSTMNLKFDDRVLIQIILISRDIVELFFTLMITEQWYVQIGCDRLFFNISSNFH